MVAHTGDVSATIKAVETVDSCIGQISDLVLSKDGCVIITADHGNAEELLNIQTGAKVKEHSTNPVPFVVIGANWEGKASGLIETVGPDLSLLPTQGMLSDVAPTILKIMNIEKPEEMTGSDII